MIREGASDDRRGCSIPHHSYSFGQQEDLMFRLVPTPSRQQFLAECFGKL